MLYSGKKVLQAYIIFISDAEAFHLLMVREWKDHISTVALTSLATKKYNKVDLMPHTEDLMKVDAYMRSEITACLDDYKDCEKRKSLDRDWFRRLCRATCGYCTIFNKRRGNEVAKMHTSAYKDRPDWKAGSNTEIMNSLSVAERKMMERWVKFICILFSFSKYILLSNELWLYIYYLFL